MNCPKCHQPMKHGFSARAASLSFVEPEKFSQFAFMDEDLSGAGLRKFFPWKAEYFRSFLCASCEMYSVDLSQVLDRKEAERLGAELLGKQP